MVTMKAGKNKRLVRKNNRLFASDKQQKNPVLRAILTVLLIVGIGYGVLCAGDCLYQLSYFEVNNIDIQGNRYVSAEQILELSGIKLKQNIFSVDLQKANQGLRSHPYLKLVMVERRLPQTIFIKVKERKGVALLEAPGGYYLIDKTGVILENAGMRNKKRLPVIKGVSPELLEVGARINQGQELLAFLRSKGLLINYASLDIRQEDNPILTTRRGRLKVYLGEGRWEDKLKNFDLVYQSLQARISSVKSIDLRYEQLAVVKHAL